MSGRRVITHWVEETRHKVEVAADQLDRGEGIDGEVVVARLWDKLQKARENQEVDYNGV